MIMTTTSTLQGHEIEKYLGIVGTEVVLGANIFKDFFAKMTDVFGGKSSTYASTLKRGRGDVKKKLVEDAKSLGAHAVIGINIDFESLGENNTILQITATGTAVRLKNYQEEPEGF